MPTHKTLWVAWFVEIACIGIGVLMAAVVGFAAGGVEAGVLAAAPFFGAATVELGRIPLVEAAFTARGVRWKLIALAMILLAACLTAENLIFGFERAFNVRIEQVRVAAEAADAAERKVADLKESASDLARAQARESEELARLDQQAERARAAADHDVGAASDTWQREDTRLQRKIEAAQNEQNALLAQQRVEQAVMVRICQNTPERCDNRGLAKRQQRQLADINQRVSVLDKEGKDHSDTAKRESVSARSSRDSELRKIQEERDRMAGTQREHVKQADDLQHQLSDATLAAQALRSAADAQRRQSQMHRLSRFFFAADDTPAAMRTLTWFSIVAALVLSSAGSVLAALHFRTLHQSMLPDPPRRLTRALRGWLARQRRKHSVVKTVEVVREVEVPVERVVERTVQIEVPVVVEKEKIVECKVEVPVIVEKERIVERKVEVEVPVEKIVTRTVEVPVYIDRVAVREVEVNKPELVLVPVPLDASEELRRSILERAARAYHNNSSLNNPRSAVLAAGE